MNNIIEKDERIIAYVKDLKKQVASEIEKFEQEREYVAKVCGNVDNDYYDSETEMLQELLETLETFGDYDLIVVEKQLMGNFICRKVTVIDSETKEEIM